MKNKVKIHLIILNKNLLNLFECFKTKREVIYA